VREQARLMGLPSRGRMHMRVPHPMPPREEWPRLAADYMRHRRVDVTAIVIDAFCARREELLIRHAIEIAVNASRQCDERAALLCLRDRLIEELTEVLERR
jgi:hypothetical protein